MSQIAALLGFFTFALGAASGLMGLAGGYAPSLPTGTTAAVLWCGGLLIMLGSAIVMALHEIAKKPKSS